MPTAQKERVVEQAREWYGKSVGLVFADYRGLKVKELQQLRRNLGEKGAEIHVIKNTLFRLAAGEDAAKFPAELHNGPTAVAFVYANESECAKVLMDFEKQTKTLAVKGGYFGGQIYDAKGVEALSKLPPREVLIAQVIGAIAAPLSNLVGVIEALYADPIRTIGAVADKLNEGAPAPTSAPEPEPAATVESAEPGSTDATDSDSAALSEAAEPSEPATEPAPEESSSPAEEAPVPASESPAEPSDSSDPTDAETSA